MRNAVNCARARERSKPSLVLREGGSALQGKGKDCVKESPEVVSRGPGGKETGGGLGERCWARAQEM